MSSKQVSTNQSAVDAATKIDSNKPDNAVQDAIVGAGKTIDPKVIGNAAKDETKAVNPTTQTEGAGVKEKQEEAAADQ